MSLLIFSIALLLALLCAATIYYMVWAVFKAIFK